VKPTWTSWRATRAIHGPLRRLRHEFEVEVVVKTGKQIEGPASIGVVGLNFGPTIARSRLPVRIQSSHGEDLRELLVSVIEHLC